MGLPFAKKLVERGHQVEVLTGFPNYPAGEIFEGYHVKLLQREILDGVSVIRVPLYPSHDRSAMKRILCYSSLAVSQSTIGPFVVKPADVAYVSQGPATIGFPAWILKLVRRIPFVYNIQDLWPDVLLSSGMFYSNIGFKLVDKWCRFVYRCAGKIVVNNPGVKKKLAERGVAADRIEVIYEWCDDLQITGVPVNPQLAKDLGMEGKFNVLFAGNMGKLQALGVVIDAAEIVASICPRVQFVLVGGGIEADFLKGKVVAKGLKNVVFLARRPVSEIGAILRLADVLLVHLKDTPLLRITVPSKTQAYMAVGRPILIAVKGIAAELVMKAEAGLPCEPENPRSIAETVLRFERMPPAELAEMGANGKRFYERELSFDIGTRKYERIFESVAGVAGKTR